MLQDLSSSMGFIRALMLVLRCKAGALMFSGVPCNSFCFLASSLHMRSSTRPFGDSLRGFVVQGNLLASRAALLTLVALARSVCWAVENPARSAIPLFPYYDHLFKRKELGHAYVFWPGGPVVSVCACKSGGGWGSTSNGQQCMCGPRNMGAYGAASLKPQLGMGNLCLCLIHFWSEHVRANFLHK